ncbi:MAG: ATP-binding cassette domain-containing protein [Deltaproteobacteria bacterium]|nr:ATP-binding cassette domain-containing protein [Deltaproteobacteria bacterium]
MLRVEGLHKSFGSVSAVQGVSFSVKKGEVVGLLGPNGAGKTTTMRLLTGFLKPDQGSVTVNGIDALKNPQAACRQIGYLPENAPSYHEMEVTEYLTYILRLRSVPLEKHTNFLKEAIRLCGLGDVVGRPIGVLSKGYKQRVCLAQALIHQPPLLILDEPTSGLDPHQIQEIRNLILEIGRERTVILSTHIMQEVQAVCQRALIIAGGKLVGEGTLEELTGRTKGVSRYVTRIRATKEELQAQAKTLPSLLIEGFAGGMNGTWQLVMFRGTAPTDQGEEIFEWVVKNHWKLGELRREAASLEDVFLELTKK